MGRQAAPEADRAGWHDPHFPPMVRFKVFIDAVEKLSDSPPEQRDDVLADLPDNDRSQLVRALALFRLRTQDGDYDDLGLRRLADPARRAAAMRDLLRTHFADHLAAVRSGIARDELEQMLAVPGRNSFSSRQKARQFLERAMEAADLPTGTIARADRSRGDRTRAAHGVEHPDVVGRPDPRDRYIAQQQDFLDQLLEQHAQASTLDEARRLQDAIETVSRRLDRLV